MHVFMQDAEVEEITQLSWPPRKIEVTYEIQFNESCIDKDPPKPLKITTIRGTSGQEIMEIAAHHNKRYRFTAKYFGHGLGYFVTKIDDVENDSEEKCYWLYYVGTKFGVSLSPVGITNWIPFPDSKIIWRYTKPVPH